MPDNSVTTGQHASKIATKAGKSTKVEAGEWLFLQEAADSLGLSEKTLRRNIKKGALKARKGKAVNAKIQVYITQDFLTKQSPEAPSDDTEDDTILDNVHIEEYTVEDVTDELAGTGTPTAEVEDFSPQSTVAGMPRDLPAIKELVNELMGPLVRRIEEQTIALNEQNRTIREQENAIEEQKIQLRLLPDLRAREEQERKERELAELEKQALKKQIEAMEAAQEALKAEAEKAAALEKEVALLKRPWWQKMLGTPDS